MTPTDDRQPSQAPAGSAAPPAAESAPRQRDDALALALDATVTSIWDYDVAADRVTLDHNWARMLGSEAGETVTPVRELLDRVHPADRRRASDAILSCRHGKSSDYQDEYRVRDIHGEWIWIHSRGRVLQRDARGHGLRMIGTNVDITQRKTRELATSRQMHFLHALNRTAVALLGRTTRHATFEMLANRSAEMLQAALVELTLIENDQLAVHACGGQVPSPAAGPNSPGEVVLSRQAIERRAPVLVNDYGALADAAPAYRQARFRAVAVFPILLGERVLGVLAFLRDARGDPFSAEDTEKGQLLAQLAALAIQNASVYEEAVQVAAERAEALQAQERIFHNFIENIDQGFYTADRRSIFTYCNPAISAVTGWSEAELRGTSSFRLVAPTDRARVIRQYRELAASRETHAVTEFHVETREHRLIWIEQTTHILREPDGRIRECRNFLRDITERRKAEAALLESERMYRELVETVTHAYYIADRRGMLTYCNPAMYRLGGFQPGELLRTSSFRLVADEDRPRVLATYRRLVADPTVKDAVCEFRVVAQTGRRFWVEQTTNFVRDAAGRVIEGRNLLQDVNARREAEVALRQSEERFRGVFDKSPVIITLLSVPEGAIVELNASAEAAFGIKLDAVRGRTSTELGLWVNPEERDEYLAKLQRDGQVPAFEARMRRQDGSAFTALYSGSLVSIGKRQYSLNTVQDITPRKMAEEASSHALALARATLESTADGLLVVDRYGRIETYNATFARMWRIPAELLVQRDDARALEFVVNQVAEPDAFLERVRDLYATPEAELMDEVRFKDGRIFERYSRPLMVDGRPAGRVWSFRDVTVARASETALRESEARFKSVFAESPVPLILLDAATGGIIEVNEVATRTFATTREAVLGRTTLDLGIWEDVDDRQRILDQLASGVNVHSVEVTLRARPGMPLNVIFHVSRVEVAGRACLLASVIDITDRKRAESLFRDLFAFSPDACIIATLRGEILDVNQRMLELFGYTRSELLGTHWTQLVPEPARARLAERMEKYFADPVPHPMGRSAPGLVARHKDGRVFPIDISLSPLQSGGERRVVAAIRDITAQLAAEEALRQSEAQLRHAQKMESLGTLAGGIAHDFNNILTGILGYTQLALSDLGPGHPAQPWLEGTLKSGERAKNLVSQILTFSRKTGTTRNPIRLQQVVVEAIELLRSTLPAMVRLESTVDPACALVLANANEFHQVILNLCTNSWHALPVQNGRIEVTLAPVAVAPDFAAAHPPLTAGPHVRLAVQDNGVGMDAATLERIFEPFFTTKEAGKGTGLGLAVVHSVVAAHAGAIRVESTPGQGTLIEIFVPTVAALDPVPPPAAADEMPRGHGETLLVVDDEPSSGNVITQLAEKLGYRPTYCSDPVRALELLGRQPFDVLVTDLAMPGMTGEELAQRALQARPALPVMLLSGFIDPPTLEKLRRLSVREIVPKPPAFAELASALGRCVRRK